MYAWIGKGSSTFCAVCILCNDDVMFMLQIFGYDSSFRIALMIPNDKLNVACNRISEFCNKHYRK